MPSMQNFSPRIPRRVALSRSQACQKGHWSRSSASPFTPPLGATNYQSLITSYALPFAVRVRRMVEKMTTESLKKFWPLMYSIIQEFWRISEPHIEDAAVRNDLPIELYLYSELGLEKFSIKNFQKRDPFSN